jgi:hypothetical protein
VPRDVLSDKLDLTSRDTVGNFVLPRHHSDELDRAGHDELAEKVRVQ